MREFFRGRRRRLGLLALVMALLLMVGWVRSFIAHDSVSLPIGSHTTIGMMSAWGSLIGCVQHHQKVATTWKITKWTTRSDPFDDDTFIGPHLFGFAIGWVSPYQKTNNVASGVLAIPYWFPVVSLFLLSCRFQQSNPEPLIWDQIRFWLILVAAIVLFFLMFSAPAVQS